MDVDAETSTITLTNHGLIDGERVVYQSSDALVGGLEIGKMYVIDRVDDNSFRLLSPDLRPDGQDLIFGGAGTDVARNDDGDLTAQGHAQDSDVIAGDNANIYRLVGVNGHVGVTPTEMDDLGLRALFEGFLSFNYDSYTDQLPVADQLRIIPRAVELVDYTPGGTDNIPDARTLPTTRALPTRSTANQAMTSFTARWVAMCSSARAKTTTSSAAMGTTGSPAGLAATVFLATTAESSPVATPSRLTTMTSRFPSRSTASPKSTRWISSSIPRAVFMRPPSTSMEPLRRR